MPEGFTDADRERIREELLAAGHELFSRHGLQKTTIADLTDEVGIAPSTFYQFFDSKGDLYVEVLEREGTKMVARVLAASFERYDDPERAISAFLNTLVDEMESNRLVRRLLVNPDELDRLRNAVGEDGQAESRRESMAYILPYVEAWYDDGRLRGPDPETVASAVRAISLLALHREDIGEERYEATMDLVIDAVAAGLAGPDGD
ncbi:MAG TPA: TetR/AcrR family transcriptional regulator [Natrialbaceae archaeon]|nr:TetR/AcrR family transcriptional regulator [Natrialbaceae archaeon]